MPLPVLRDRRGRKRRSVYQGFAIGTRLFRDPGHAPSRRGNSPRRQELGGVPLPRRRGSPPADAAPSRHHAAITPRVSGPSPGTYRNSRNMLSAYCLNPRLWVMMEMIEVNLALVASKAHGGPCRKMDAIEEASESRRHLHSTGPTTVEVIVRADGRGRRRTPEVRGFLDFPRWLQGSAGRHGRDDPRLMTAISRHPLSPTDATHSSSGKDDLLIVKIEPATRGHASSPLLRARRTHRSDDARSDHTWAQLIGIEHESTGARTDNLLVIKG